MRVLRCLHIVVLRAMSYYFSGQSGQVDILGGQGDKRGGPVLVFLWNLGRVEVTQGRRAPSIGEYVGQFGQLWIGDWMGCIMRYFAECLVFDMMVL